MASSSERRFIKWHWGYVIILCKFVVMGLDSGIAKSFGVLIPEMVIRLNTNYAHVGFICSLPSTMVYFACPFISLALEKMSGRVVALAGAVTAGLCMIACAFVSNVVIMGLLLTLTGAGLACVYMTSILLLNDHFPDRFILMNTFTLYGYTAGATILPLIVERSREAYGYSGSFLIWAGINCNIIACAAALRKPSVKDQYSRRPHPQVQTDPSTPCVLDQTEVSGGNDDERTEEMTREVLPLEMNTPQSPAEDRMRSTASHTVDQLGTTTSHVVDNAWTIASPPVDETRSTASRGINKRWTTASPAADEKRSNNITSTSIDETRSTASQEDGNLRASTENLFRLARRDEESRQQDHTSSINSSTHSNVKQIDWFETCCSRFSLLDEKLFLFNLPTFFATCYTASSWMLFLVPHAEQLGISESRAVLLSTIGGIGGIFGRTVFIISRMKNINVFIVYIAAGITLTVTFLIDAVGSAFNVRAGIAFVQGFCVFIEDTVCFTVVKLAVRNQTNFSRASGLMLFFAGLGSNSAGYVAGLLFDLTHSYTKVFVVIGIIHCVAVVNIIITTIWMKIHP